MMHQSLYLRYRPARFGEIIGQAHVVAALRNAVSTDRVGHAYLFSGPRGTGKTSTARILAKALNCEDLVEGEPCGGCPSCMSIAGGTSYELHELDAASNNKVDDIRELISRVAIGTPGRVKVYVLDEVHMLTTGAENALLKTLEEPPPHVVFVLCTTEPHKVAPTIRSRTQHLHFELLGVAELQDHVRAVAADAGLVVSDADLAYVLAAGGGSARDTLSALDAVAAAGRAPDGADVVTALLEAVANSDTAAALGAADAAARAGREPRIVGEAVLGRLRNAFLASLQAPLDHLPSAERAAAEDLAGRLRPRALTFALELLGESLVAMREAPDPRVDLDLALVRLTAPHVGVTLASLAERVERLERGSAAGVVEPTGADEPARAKTARRESGPTGTAPEHRSAPRGRPGDGAREAPGRARPPEQSTAPRERPGDGAREALGRARPPEPAPTAEASRAEPASEPAADPPAGRPAAARPAADSSAPSPVGSSVSAADGDSMTARPDAESRPIDSPVDDRATGPADGSTDRPFPAGSPPDRDDAVLAWVEEILPSLRTLSSLPRSAGARLAAGRFLPNGTDALRLAFPTPGSLERCEDLRPSVEAEFGRCFHRPVAVEFVLDDRSTPPPPSVAGGSPTARSPYLGQLLETTTLPRARSVEGDRSGVAQVQQAFPGSRLVELDAG